MFYLLIALHIGNEKRGDLKDMNGSCSEAYDYNVLMCFRPRLDFRIFMLLSCSKLALLCRFSLPEYKSSVYRVQRLSMIVCIDELIYDLLQW